MLTESFCDILEYHLTKSFKMSKDVSIKSFWCDGILLPSNENEYSLKTVNDKRYVLMTAFAGNDGQEQYTLKLNFGNKALSKYARGLDLKGSLPDYDNPDWLVVDKKNKIIKVQLY